MLVHPNPLDGTSWLFQVAHLSTWYRTFTVDLPGYGHSPRLTGPTTMPDLAAAAWRAVTRAGAGSVVIGGISIGAALALHMARQEPARTRALVLSGYGDSPGKPFAQRRIDGYRAGGLAYRREHLREGLSPAFRGTAAGRDLDAILEDRGRLADVPSIIRLFEAHGAPDPADLFDVAAPTLIISGSLDYALPGSRRMHERIRGSEMAIIEGAGHACNLEAPVAWNRHALDFLGRRLGEP